MTDIKKVELEFPIKRDGGDISVLTLRRPVAGDARNGLSMAKLGQLDYDEIRKLLPRISIEGLVDAECDSIPLSDMMEIAGELTDFLVPKRRMKDFQTA